MPLNTSITRNGDTLKLRWGDFHVAAMALAATLEQPVEERKLWTSPVEVEAVLQELGYPDEPLVISPRMAFDVCNYGTLSLTPLNAGTVTLTKPHRFRDQMDGELLELQPGDVLRAFRS